MKSIGPSRLVLSGRQQEREDLPTINLDPLTEFFEIDSGILWVYTGLWWVVKEVTNKYRKFCGRTPGEIHGDILYISPCVTLYTGHYIATKSGGVSVDVSLDGESWIENMVMFDLCDTNPKSTKVITTTTGILFLRGRFELIRVRQAGSDPAKTYGAHFLA